MNYEAVKIEFDASTIQKATCVAIVRAIAKSLATKDALMVSVAAFAASQTRNKVSEAAQQSIVTARPLPSLSFNGVSLSDGDWKKRKSEKYLKQKEELLSFCLEESKAWSRRRLTTNQQKNIKLLGRE